MCTVGGAPTGDMNFDDDRVKGKRYRCIECDEKFSHINPSRKPICPGCESDNVIEI